LIRIGNIQRLVEDSGQARVSMLLHAFADRLRELIRTTDVCTRTSENQFWLLLPFTDSSAGQKLMHRLDVFQKETQQQMGVSLQLDVELFSSDIVKDKPQDSEMLMTELAGRLE
jgi:GGDEF domain-containing protein